MVSAIPNQDFPLMSPQAATTLDQPALLSIDGAVATITLNRPDAFNSINLAIAKRLEELAAQIAKDDSIRVVVIEGNGRAFCGGGDIQVFGANMDNLAPVVSELLHHFHNFIAAIRRMPKLVLTSVHGSAAGAGLSLAFIADMCIAANDAKFTPAYNKLGVSPDGGGTIGVTETVGSRRALQIFLAEDSFNAQQAYDWGLVAKLAPPDQLKEATRELAQRLAKNSPDAIKTTKALIHAANRTPIEQQLEAEAAGIASCMTTETFRAAVGKFLGKSK
jgi:enoyl-CoA hydratase/carnithine racemase